MADVDVQTADAVGQAELVRSGQLSALELVDAAIARIEALNPVLNAVVYECFDEARRVASGPLSGPFAGVPLLLKDLGCPVAGHPSHSGSIVLKRAGVTADRDSALARRFKDAGFVILGRTNVPEFGLVSDTQNRAYGVTRNPWDLERTPAGSSGGAAAAVAAGMVAVAHGSDGGGSIRMPASNCGLVGLKASRGRISEAPGGDPMFGHIVSGVLTRTVRDTAAIVDAIAGPEPGDPVVAPAPSAPFVEAVSRRPGALKIGFVVSSPSTKHATAPACSSGVEIAAELLEDAGHHVENAWPAALFDERYWSNWFDTLSPVVTLIVDDALSLAGDEDATFDAVTQLWDRRGREITAAELTAAIGWLDDYRRRIAAWWADGYDVLVTPVSTEPAALLGRFWSYPGGIEDSVDILQYAPQFNSTGQPAISVPIDWTEAGLPVGVQLVGRYGAEEMLLSLAAEIEERRPWAHRCPPSVA